MLRVILIAVAALGVAAILFVLWAYWSFDAAMRADVERLKSGASGDQAVVTEAMIAGLPGPAQRYVRYAGVVGKPIPTLVRLRQSGRIRSSLDAAWMEFEAEEVYSTNPPAFVWRVFLPRFGMPVALGRDEYLEGKGSILIRMLALFPVADLAGEELAAAGLMRYLNEMTSFPAALLGSNVTITPVDDTSFAATISDRGMSATGTFIVDPDGRLTNFRAPRFNTTTGTIETWETPFTAYAEMEGLKLPSAGAAVWKLPTGDLAYIELEITELRYDEPRAP